MSRTKKDSAGVVAHPSSNGGSNGSALPPARVHRAVRDPGVMNAVKSDLVRLMRGGSTTLDAAKSAIASRIKSDARYGASDGAPMQIVKELVRAGFLVREGRKLTLATSHEPEVEPVLLAPLPVVQVPMRMVCVVPVPEIPADEEVAASEAKEPGAPKAPEAPKAPSKKDLRDALVAGIRCLRGHVPRRIAFFTEEEENLWDYLAYVASAETVSLPGDGHRMRVYRRVVIKGDVGALIENLRETAPRTLQFGEEETADILRRLHRAGVLSLLQTTDNDGVLKTTYEFRISPDEIAVLRIPRRTERRIGAAYRTLIAKIQRECTEFPLNCEGQVIQRDAARILDDLMLSEGILNIRGSSAWIRIGGITALVTGSMTAGAGVVVAAPHLNPNNALVALPYFGLFVDGTPSYLNDVIEDRAPVPLTTTPAPLPAVTTTPAPAVVIPSSPVSSEADQQFGDMTDGVLAQCRADLITNVTDWDDRRHPILLAELARLQTQMQDVQDALDEGLRASRDASVSLIAVERELEGRARNKRRQELEAEIAARQATLRALLEELSALG